MPNYYGLARLNYFRVKIPAALKQWTESLGLKVINQVDLNYGPTRYGIVADTNEGWPVVRFIKNPRV